MAYMLRNTIINGGPSDAFEKMHCDSRGLPTFIIMKDVKPTRRGARVGR